VHDQDSILRNNPVVDSVFRSATHYKPPACLDVMPKFAQKGAIAISQDPGQRIEDYSELFSLSEMRVRVRSGIHDSDAQAMPGGDMLHLVIVPSSLPL
jgi:hypothetical protein